MVAAHQNLNGSHCLTTTLQDDLSKNGHISATVFKARGSARVFPDTVIASQTGYQVIHVQILNIMFRNSCRPKNHTSTIFILKEDCRDV